MWHRLTLSPYHKPISSSLPQCLRDRRLCSRSTSTQDNNCTAVISTLFRCKRPGDPWCRLWQQEELIWLCNNSSQKWAPAHRLHLKVTKDRRRPLQQTRKPQLRKKVRGLEVGEHWDFVLNLDLNRNEKWNDTVCKNSWFTQIIPVTWLDVYSGAALIIRIPESYRITQASRNRVTWPEHY